MPGTEFIEILPSARLFLRAFLQSTPKGDWVGGIAGCPIVLLAEGGRGRKYEELR